MSREYKEKIQQLAREIKPGTILYNVIQGSSQTIASLVSEKPQLLVGKGSVSDYQGQTFSNVSPLQMMLFLYDTETLDKILPLIPEELHAEVNEQCLEMQGGGADLVKLNVDPRTVPFENLTQYTEGEATYPLLENQDGIICWDDKFFYANQETQEVTLIDPMLNDDDDESQGLIHELTQAVDSMEDNSACRTSNIVHQACEKILGHKLVRNGIDYERNGVHYRDTKDEIPLINAYKKYFHKYAEHQAGTRWDDVHQERINGVGLAQRLLPQKILHKFPGEGVHIIGKVPGLGKEFSLDLHRGNSMKNTQTTGYFKPRDLRSDLLELNHVLENKKEQVKEFIQEIDTKLHPREGFSH